MGTETDATGTTPRVVRTKDRYEIWVGDRLGGFTTIKTDDAGRLVFPNTHIDDAFAGQGLGSTLVGEALADAARRGETVVPVCPFVVHYLERHEVPGLQVERP